MTIPFWQIPFAELSYARLRSFLDDRIPEGNHYEYKQAHFNEKNRKFEINDEFLETLVAFANSSGGMLICGVAEDKDVPRTPGKTIGIETGPPRGITDPERTLRNRSENLIEPHIPLEIKVLDIEEDTNDDRNLKILVVRVHRGAFPPYNLRPKGIFIRNDEGDHRASVRQIEALFSHRPPPPSFAQHTPWERINLNVFGGMWQYEHCRLLE